MDPKAFKTSYFPLHLDKCWQLGKTSLVWQVSAYKKHGLPKKFYLIIDTNQNSYGINFKEKKPLHLTPQSTVVGLLRKNIIHGILEKIIEDAEKNLWIFIKDHHQKEFYLRLMPCSPPELCFISSEKKCLFRMGQKGIFTVKKDFSDPIPALEKEFPTSIYLETTTSEETGIPSPDFFDSQQGFSELQKKVKDRLKRRARTLKKVLEKDSHKVYATKSYEELEQDAHLLQNFAYTLFTADEVNKKMPSEIKVPLHLSGLDHDITISLNSDLSLGENIEQKFIDLKKRFKTISIGEKRLSDLKNELESMLEKLTLLREKNLDDDELMHILKKFSLDLPLNENKESSKTKESSPFKIFHSSQGALLYVGKSAQESDLLVKQAKANDYWFHVVQGTGSHVIIPLKSLKNHELDESTKKEAALLALHYSKLRTDRAGEVYMTRRHDLKKRKGMPPGLWLIEKSETIFVRYTQEELQNVLNPGKDGF